MADIQTSIHGRRFGLGADNELISEGTIILNNAQKVAISVATNPASPRAVTLQVTDSNGKAIKHCQDLELTLLADSAGADFAATGGSTGIAASVGKLLAVVAKKYFKARTNNQGQMTLSWTDTAHEVAYLGVKLPSGVTYISAALTTA